jgi:putative membrane protein
MLILGFVIGSIMEVFPGIPTGFDMLISLVAFALGFVIIIFMSKKYSE